MLQIVEETMDYSKDVRKVLWVTLLLNLAVAAVKIVYGVITNAQSMQADGFHSLFDGTSNVIGIIGIWLSAKPPDIKHHYGHKKFETMATIGIATLLFLTCVEILKRAVWNIMDPMPIQVTKLSFGIMIFTMGVNIFVTVYEGRRGRAFKSDFLMADAKHTMSDLIASTTVLVSLVATKMGYHIIDPIAAFFIALMIGRLGYGILLEASDVLVDASPLNDAELAKVLALARSVEGVKDCHNVRVRGRNDAVHVDCHVLVPHGMSMGHAHEIASKVEELIKTKMPEVVDVVVHLEPKE